MVPERSVIRVPAELVQHIRTEAKVPSMAGFKALVAEIQDYLGIDDRRARCIAETIGYPISFGLWFWEV